MIADFSQTKAMQLKLADEMLGSRSGTAIFPGPRPKRPVKYGSGQARRSHHVS